MFEFKKGTARRAEADGSVRDLRRLRTVGTWVGALAIALVITLPTLSFGFSRKDCRCRSCARPCQQCCCPSHVHSVPTAQMVPVTQYTTQPVTTYRDVTETAYRNEPYVETVPRTVLENVTVDEGGYQQVWVPRVVTKQVSRTVMEQRTAFRTVPVTVTKRVPETTYQTVARSSYQCVPGGHTTGLVVPPTATSYVTSTPSVASAPALFAAPAATYTTSSSYTGSSYTGGPTSAVGPTPVATESKLVPDAQYSDPPTAILPRSSRLASTANTPVAAPRPAESRTAPESTAARGMFVPAPSAASVWRYSERTTIR